MLSVLPVPGVETLKGGAFVTPVPAVSTLAQGRSRWQGVALESFECVPGCRVPEHCHPVHFITLQTGGNIRTEWTSGGRSRSARQAPGSISILPKGSQHRHQWSDASSRIVVTLESEFLARAADQTAHMQDVELIECWDVRDSHIASLLMALHLDAKAGHPAGPIYGETIATALALYLVRTQAVRSVDVRPPRGHLSHRQLHRTREFIDANLGHDLRLSELASVAGLSSQYFSELFRRSTGLSPHQYVLRARVERAKLLLRLSNEHISDIAATTGFADQSHFSKVFRALSGMTPRQFRSRA